MADSTGVERPALLSRKVLGKTHLGLRGLVFYCAHIPYTRLAQFLVRTAQYALFPVTNKSSIRHSVSMTTIHL